MTSNGHSSNMDSIETPGQHSEDDGLESLLGSVDVEYDAVPEGIHLASIEMLSGLGGPETALTLLEAVEAGVVKLNTVETALHMATTLGMYPTADLLRRVGRVGLAAVIVTMPEVPADYLVEVACDSELGEVVRDEARKRLEHVGGEGTERRAWCLLAAELTRLEGTSVETIEMTLGPCPPA